jgi:hypothetical protein
MRFLPNSFRVSATCFLLLLLGVGLAWGQAGTSTIRGTVTDPQGGVVPGATVTIINPKTNFTRTMTATESGNFSFDLIPPGDYRVEVHAPGFSKKVVSPVQALVGTIVDTSVKLEVGAITQIVEVQAAVTAATVNTEDATMGNNFVSQQITALPMESRNVQALLTLQPQVTPDGYVAGARSDQSNVTLDGVDINEAQTNALDGPVLRLNSEAIEEFRVATTNANANMGRSSAAQVNLVTKSGGNDFHAVLFEYHRNTIFTANDFFNNRSDVKRPKLLRNTFGGTFGGPFKKNKLFFFYSYEGFREAKETSVVEVVPLPLMGQGQMKVVAETNCGAPPCPTQVVTLTTANLNTIYPTIAAAGGLNSAGLAVLAQAAARYPANDNTQGDQLNTSGFRFNAPVPIHRNSHVGKIDWIINNKQTFFVRANYIHDLVGAAPEFPDTPSPSTWTHPTGLVVSHNWNFANNWVNNIRYGLTRQAFTRMGDSAQNATIFRFVFYPFLDQRTLTRITPMHNIVDDLSWIKGSHTFSFGTNIRLVDNTRTTFANAFDEAVMNPSFYAGAGASVSNPIDAYLVSQGFLGLVSVSEAQDAATSLIGRYTQYTANFTFDQAGTLVQSGLPTHRIMATREYDWYFQDSWKVMPTLTLTYGLRYNLSQPVFEKQGFGVVTDISGSEYLARRAAGAAAGTPFTQPLQLTLAGGDGKGSLYTWDKNNLQPRVSAAWSPKFENNFLQKLFGSGGQSVIRAGFGMTNDYFGQSLAVNFDLNNTLGFSSNYTLPANSYNVTTRLGPLFSAIGQAVRPLPQVIVPGNITWPRQQPSNFKRRIESGIDTELTAPVNYMWNLTIERELPAKMLVQFNYTGRLGRKLLAQRDVMALNNLRDPKTGLDWYQAATALEKFRQATALPAVDFTNATTTAATLPPFLAAYVPAFNAAFPASSAVAQYFANIFPATLADDYYNCCSAAWLPFSSLTPAQAALFIAYDQGWGNDWTDTQDMLEAAGGQSYFFNPQYGALNAWSTVANSNYHGFSVSLRQRAKNLQWDLNYTYSHSLDDASGLQAEGNYGTGSFIMNAFRQRDNYASSDFDIRHQINANFIYNLPIGRGQWLGSGMGNGWNALVGGWRLSGVFRWNTGLPLISTFDDARWATNWEVQSYVEQIKAVAPCITKGDATNPPKLFGCNTAAAYASFRNAYPGETGQRNIFRMPNLINLDLGLLKEFTMPWSEKQKLQLSWEVFNVTNTQRFGVMDTSRTGFGLGLDPVLNNLTPPSNWSNWTGMQTPGGREPYRVMQIGIKLTF